MCQIRKIILATSPQRKTETMPNIKLTKFFKLGAIRCKPIPVMKTGFSLCMLSLQGKTCFHYKFFPVKKAYTGKTLFSLQGWVCSVVSKVVANQDDILTQSSK